MSEPRVFVNLGEVHELFQVWCQQHNISMYDALKSMARQAISGQHVVTSGEHSTAIRLRLGELHAPFLAWCEQGQHTASSAMRELVKHMLLRGMLASSASMGLQGNGSIEQTVADGFQAVSQIGIQDLGHARIEIRLSKSEHDTITKIAAVAHTTGQKLIRQIVRAFMLKSAAFTAQETANFGASNLALMRIGNNLNQIARRLNADSQAQADREEIRQCLAQIDAHVKSCAQALELSRERWRIELKD